MIVRNHLHVTELARSRVLLIGEVEFLIVKISNKSTKSSLCISIVYRPPIDNSFDRFFQIFNNNARKFENRLILGDFNAHLQTRGPNALELLSLVKAVQMQLLDTGATYHQTMNVSWLDAIFSDDLTKIVDFQKSFKPFIDFHHFFIFHYISL